MELKRTCNYVIDHFNELTLYLTVPQRPYTNTESERTLRIERLMLNGSKFRKTEMEKLFLMCFLQ
jgi:hypothetical protein